MKRMADSSVLNNHSNEQRKVICYQVVHSEKKTAMETFKRKMKNRLRLCRREDEIAASQAISGGSCFKSH